MAADAGSIRAGKAFVELYTDNAKLNSGMADAKKKMQAFSQQIEFIGKMTRGLGIAAVAVSVGHLWDTLRQNAVGEAAERFKAADAAIDKARGAMGEFAAGIASQAAPTIQVLAESLTGLTEALGKAKEGWDGFIDSMGGGDETGTKLERAANKLGKSLSGGAIGQLAAIIEAAKILSGMDSKGGIGAALMGGAQGIPMMDEERRKADKDHSDNLQQLADLQERAATEEMTWNEKIIRQLKERGASLHMLKNATIAIERVQKKQGEAEEKRQQEAMQKQKLQDVENFKQSLESPFEKFAAALEKIKGFKAENLIDDNQLKQGVNKFREEMLRPALDNVVKAGAMGALQAAGAPRKVTTPLDIAGTFNPFAVSGLGADSISKRQADGIDQLVRIQGQALKEIRDGGRFV